MYDLSSRENNMNKNKGLNHRYASMGVIAVEEKERDWRGAELQNSFEFENSIC